MSWRDNSEGCDPPHSHGRSRKRDRLKQQKHQENCRPVAVCFLLLAGWRVPVVKDYWRKNSGPDREHCTQAVDNRESDEPVFPENYVFPHVACGYYAIKNQQVIFVSGEVVTWRLSIEMAFCLPQLAFLRLELGFHLHLNGFPFRLSDECCR